MKIGIDARMLGAGFGLARYIQQLVLHLEKIDRQNQYVIFLRRENWDEFKPTNSNFIKVLADIPWYGIAEQLKLPSIIKKQKVDLMHFPHWNVPLIYSDHFLVTIHDLIMYHFPRPTATTLSPLAYRIKDHFHRLVVKNAVKCSSGIIATSEFTKTDIQKTLGVKEEKIIVTYQAPFSPNNTLQNLSPASLKNFFDKHNINRDYILYVGAAYPHKNLDKLIKGWKIFIERNGNENQLVLVGKENYFYKKLINDYNLPQLNIIYTGYLPDEELEILYNHALLYIFPGLYEGFGLPPLEAMAHNLPVASSDSSCLPEILQDAAYYFNPNDERAISDAIQHLSMDQSLRARLTERGQKLRASYSWDKIAAETLSIYKNSDI